MKTKEFISRFNEAEVIQRMTSVKTPEEAYSVAKEYGVTDSLEEFVEEMTKFKAAIEELSEEDLEAVAGGLTPVEATYTVLLSVATAGTVTVSATGSALVSVVSLSAATVTAAASGLALGAAATAAV